VSQLATCPLSLQTPCGLAAQLGRRSGGAEILVGALAVRQRCPAKRNRVRGCLTLRPGVTLRPRIHQREHDPALPWSHLRYHMLGPVGPVCGAPPPLPPPPPSLPPNSACTPVSPAPRAAATPLETYGRGDGEKRACGLSQQRPPCVVISIGSNGEWEFEEDVRPTTPIPPLHAARPPPPSRAARSHRRAPDHRERSGRCSGGRTAPCTPLTAPYPLPPRRPPRSAREFTSTGCASARTAALCRGWACMFKASTW
jgi:hypothetical protein